MQKRIILTGFMGTGKTAIGKAVALQLQWPFQDLDRLIIETSGQSIAELFASSGEAQFRALEKKALHEVLGQSPLVLATGGGAIVDPESRAQMKAAGLLVCLSAPLATLLKRLVGNRSRPLLQVPDPAAEIQRLIADREPFYKEAHYVLDSSQGNPDECARRIVCYYREKYGGSVQGKA